MAKQQQTDWYANLFSAWPTKMVGRKPTNAELATAHAFGKAGKQSLALALAMREAGVTASQIQIVCGAPQNNHRRGLITEGMFKRVPTPADSLNHTVYKIELTAKGKAVVDGKTSTKTAKPDKAAKPATKKAARKPRVKAPVTEAPAMVAAPVPVQPEAEQPQA